jgi:hypothetical protein
MKNVSNYFKFWLILMLLAIQSVSYSQIIKNKIINYKIDTVHVLPAVGYINYPYEGKVVPNDSLNAMFIYILKYALPTATNYKLSYISNDSLFDKTSIKYLVDIIPQIRKMTEETFSKISIGVDLEKLTDNQSGRYFAIILYQGFVQEITGKDIGKSMALGMATALLTGGLFFVTTVPIHPYLKADLLILDKQSKRFLFYNGRYLNVSPLDVEKIQKEFTKLLNKL